MDLFSFSYNSTKALDVKSPDYLKFKNHSGHQNIIYFFFKGTECLYIGETENSIFDRCFINTPKHKDIKLRQSITAKLRENRFLIRCLFLRRFLIGRGSLRIAVDI